MRLLITGGPGAGCTSTAEKISQATGIPMFDSDTFFHKPSDPPFLEQYSAEERRLMLGAVLSQRSSWIVSGSVATWGLSAFEPTHGILLDMPRAVRLQRLAQRQRNQFGSRIDRGGDLHDEHESFIAWAAAYEERTGVGRNLATDLGFLMQQCHRFMIVDLVDEIDVVAGRIINFLSNNEGTNQ